MPLTSVDKDLDALTLTVVADYPVPVRRVWDAYADPRQIERFWGPPGYPATFTRHDLVPGGWSTYYMTSPDGVRSHGYWEFLAVDPGRSFEVRDGFVGPDGEPAADLPTMVMTMRFEEASGGTRVTTTTRFPGVEDLERLLAMGLEEGMTGSLSQVDDVLEDLASFAADRTAEVQLLGDAQARVARVIRGPVELVWQAHHDPALLRRWQLGPDGWTMPVCEVAGSVGDTYRYEWEQDGGGERFGFTGELLESVPPTREVTTERMLGTEGPTTRNELTLTPVADGTLLVLVVTYPDAATREAVLATGMVDGMEASYARLESEVLAGV